MAFAFADHFAFLFCCLVAAWLRPPVAGAAAVVRLFTRGRCGGANDMPLLLVNEIVLVLQLFFFTW